MVKPASTQELVTAEPSEISIPLEPEVAEIVAERQVYRERLIEDFTTTANTAANTAAKKIQLPKSQVMAQIKSHPEIVKIGTSLSQLLKQSSADYPAADHCATEIEA